MGPGEGEEIRSTGEGVKGQSVIESESSRDLTDYSKEGSSPGTTVGRRALAYFWEPIDTTFSSSSRKTVSKNPIVLTDLTLVANEASVVYCSSSLFLKHYQCPVLSPVITV